MELLVDAANRFELDDAVESKRRAALEFDRNLRLVDANADPVVLDVLRDAFEFVREAEVIVSGFKTRRKKAQ